MNPTSLRDDSPPLPAYPGETKPSPAARPETLSSILDTIHSKKAPSTAASAKKHAVQESRPPDSEDSSSEDSSSASSSDASESSSGSDSDSDASSDSDSTSSDEEAGPPISSAKPKNMRRDLPKSDSESTSSPSEEDAKGAASGSAADGASSESSDTDDSSDSSDSSSDSSVKADLRKQVPTPAPPPKAAPEKPEPVAAGVTPLTRTQKRNLRRREARRHKAALARAEAEAASSATGTAIQDDELTKRRQALLESLEVGVSPVVTPKKRKAEDEDTGSKSAAQNGSGPPAAKTQDSAPSQRKKSFNFSAPGRLLFNALGFGGSKDKEGGQMSDVQRNGHNEAPQGAESEDLEDPDAWKSKINYRAVECVREGVELSEPPFPFVQRWDPQQRADVWYGNGKRGGKGKRKQRNQAHYYEEDTGHGKKRKTSPWPELLEYDEDANVDGQDRGENGLEQDHAQNTSDAPDDLPDLPEDVNTLPRLARGEAAPGMVITWKQWLLSKATNWQPQFGNVTAVVVRRDESDPDVLHVLLAKRDRNLDRNEKEYDPQTGQRIYDGFEAPDLDEEEGEEGGDDGSRLVSFAEMVDPRVVQRQSANLEATLGNSSANFSKNESGNPESHPQDGQRDVDYEPLSMDLQVPFATDHASADELREAEQPGSSDRADGHSQKNAVDVPSAASSIASGRRQPDPNFLPASTESDMVIPDSAQEPPVDNSRSQESERQKSRSHSVQNSQGVARSTNHSPPKGKVHRGETGAPQSSVPDAPVEEIKPAGRNESFFEMGDEYLPKKLRREANGLAALKKEGGGEADEEEDGVIDLKREASLPRLVFPDDSPPRFGSQKEGGQKEKRKDRTSLFEVPAGSQVIDLVSEGESAVGTRASSQQQRNGTSRGQSEDETPRSSQKQTETPASQRTRKGTRASPKTGSQKSDGLPKGPGRVKKRKGWKAETAV